MGHLPPCNEKGVIADQPREYLQTHPDISYLTFQLLNRKDLRSLCRVSKSCKALATPLLYRSVDLIIQQINDEVVEQDPIYQFSELLSFLLDDRNTHVRDCVRDLTVESGYFGVNRLFRPSVWTQPTRVPGKFEDEFILLLGKLPNLKNIHLNVCVPLTQRSLEATGSHAGRPHLHLLQERSKTQVTVPMPMVRTLKISASLISSGSAGTDKLNLRALFDVCPNLRHLSVSLDSFRTGCTLARWRGEGTTIVPFTYTQGKRLPPLESLSLSGYSIKSEEVSHWRDGFLWKNLKSLTLGPDSNKGFLKMIPGHLLSLKTFEISTWNLESKRKHKELNAFLLAFNTLETLTVTGYYPSNAAIGNHRQLKHLLLHQIEQPDEPRSFLAIDDLRMLDEACPDLEQLELDISRDQDGKWPKESIDALTKGFSNLRVLNFHVALGIKILSCKRGGPRERFGWLPSQIFP